MEMLNQSISTPVEHQHHIQNTDMGSVNNYMQQQRQQPSQMSGPHQRPSNGSNNSEQHAMRPATAGGDPSNHVFNDQESLVNGHLQQSNSFQMQQQNMMHIHDNTMQQNQDTNQMISHNLAPGQSSARLPSLTLKNNNYSTSPNMQTMMNGNHCQIQQRPHQNQAQQMNHYPYDSNSMGQDKIPSSTMTVKEQLYSQQSAKPNSTPRMNPPVQNNQYINQHSMHQNMHHENAAYQQNPPHQNCEHVHQNSTHPTHVSMGQSGVQNNDQMMQMYQVSPSQDQVAHLSHMDSPPTQHSMTSSSQSQPRQHVNQMNFHPNQMSMQNTVQSEKNFSSNSSASISSDSSIISPTKTSYGNCTPPSISPTVIPMNANSTTQILMAINNNSPITAEQLQEIQNMTRTGPDGTEILLMQEPRLKQYTNLKDMSTADLRSECKKRTLPSTGTKIKLSERLAHVELEILEERNHSLMKEYNYRQQMYEAQASTLKAFQAKKATLQVQKEQPQNNFGAVNDQMVSSNEISSTTQTMPNLTREGPPAKKKRVSKPRKTPQVNKQKSVNNTNIGQIDNANTESVGNNPKPSRLMNLLANTQSSLLTGNMNNVGNQGNQNRQHTSTSSNLFGNINQSETGFFMKDNSCFSHLGSGCRLISSASSEDSQSSFGGTGRAFQASVPPPPVDSQNTYQRNNHQEFENSEQIPHQNNNVQQQSEARPMNLNQQQMIENYTVNQNSNNTFNFGDSILVQNASPPSFQQTQQPQQPHQTPQNQPNQPNQRNQQSRQNNYANPASQNGLQGSPCIADQAGPSPNMPINDSSATTSSSPIIPCSSVENHDSAELMDIETMQKLLSPATLRAREELLTQQQSRINELVKMIQMNHDTLREQQQQINLAKKQQKLRQKQTVSAAACVIDKHVNNRCIQQAIKSRQNLQILSDLTTQQDSIRTAETRLIEQLHINTATDDIARLIKQDGRTALVIVSLLHDYRTTREQNNRSKATPEETASTDKTVEVTKKKTQSRKRNNNGSKVTTQVKKQNQPQNQPDIEVVQVIEKEQKMMQPQIVPQMRQQRTQSFLEFPQPQVPQRPRSQSDVDMEAIFKTVIDASRGPKFQKSGKNQTLLDQNQSQHQMDNEVVSLPSEVSSPARTQSQNSVQSVYSEGAFTKTMIFQHEASPVHMALASTTSDNGSEINSSSDNFHNNAIDQHQQMTNSKQPDIIEILPQLERNTMEQDLEGHQFHETMIFNEDSNQQYIDQNSQNDPLNYEFPDIDQMVANIRDSDPLSCPLDDIDLTAILNSWTENCDSRRDQNSVQEETDMCGTNMFDQNGTMGQLHEDFEWNDFHAPTNIINQAFEQSQLH